MDNFKDLIKEAENQASQANGPNKYVIRALVPLIQSNKLVVDSNEKVQDAIKSFEDSTEKTEKKIRNISWIGILIAFAQFTLAIAIWKGL